MSTRAILSLTIELLLFAKMIMSNSDKYCGSSSQQVHADPNDVKVSIFIVFQLPLRCRQKAWSVVVCVCVCVWVCVRVCVGVGVGVGVWVWLCLCLQNTNISES